VNFAKEQATMEQEHVQRSSVADADPVPPFPARRVIGIAGPIAAGKSTLGQNLVSAAQALWPAAKISFEEERVIQPLLSIYIKDAAQYAAHFQTVMAMLSANRQHCAQVRRDVNAPDSLIFVERPLWENQVFARANMLCGFITDQYYREFYCEILNALHEQHPDLIVYLHVDERERLKRQGIRDRLDENLYQDTYLNTLAECYFEFCIEHIRCGRLIVLDWTQYQDPDKVICRLAETIGAIDTAAHGSDCFPRIEFRGDIELALEATRCTIVPTASTDEQPTTLCLTSSSVAARREAMDSILVALSRNCNLIFE
jgi:deoxyadenosine/deoxycytidine kinase